MKHIDIIRCAFLKQANFWNSGQNGATHASGDPAVDNAISSKKVEKPDSYEENEASNSDTTDPNHPNGKEVTPGNLWTGTRSVNGSGKGPQLEPDVDGGFQV